jgi:putative toxin-antitoxin system antitoxin component (TIGR02293 family)
MATQLVQPKIRKARTAATPGSTGGGLWVSFAKGGPDNYSDIFDMRAVDRVAIIKTGVPASVMTTISKDMELPRDRFVRLIGVPPATANRKLANNANLSRDESERLVGLTKLIGQVEAMVRESGNPAGFKPAKWFSRWIETPVPALGGRKPEEFLDTSDGREAVSTLLAQMQSGAYA